MRPGAGDQPSAVDDLSHPVHHAPASADECIVNPPKQGVPCAIDLAGASEVNVVRVKMGTRNNQVAQHRKPPKFLINTTESLCTQCAHVKEKAHSVRLYCLSRPK